MSLNTAQLWQSIQENGLASAAECRNWASNIVETSGATSLNDPQLLLAQLVKLKKITPFQANAFLSNSSQTLTIGRHRLLAPLTSPALTHWFEAIDLTSNAARWIYAIPASQLQLEELLRHPPSLLYSKKQASVKGDSLQSMSPPAMLDGYLIVAATPALGKPLRDELKNYHHNVLPNEKAMKIIFSLSVALADLHKQGVVHGRIGIDQIWWDGADQVTLLRDPFFPPVSPLIMDVPVAVGVAADQDFRIRYAAPEFTAPAQQPTPATDMYALGCLWWELLSGRLPFWDTMLDKVPTSACMFPLAIPQNTGLTQGQQKCLEYLLAKTPSSRFQNGSDFLTALKVVVPRDWMKPESVDPANVPKSKGKTLTTDSNPRLPVKTEPQSTPAVANVSIPIDTPPKPTTQAKPASRVATPPIANPRLSSKSPSRKKKKKPVWLLPSMIGGSVALLGLLAWMLTGTSNNSNTVTKNGEANQIQTGESDLIAASSDASLNSTANATAPGVQVRPTVKPREIDPRAEQFIVATTDNSFPWLPPRASKPYSLEMLPPGIQGLLVVRPAVWLDEQTGIAKIEALSKPIEMLWAPIQKSLGATVADIQQVSLGLYSSSRDEGFPESVYRITLTKPATVSTLKTNWSNYEEQPAGEKNHLWANGTAAIFTHPGPVDEEREITQFTWGPINLIRDLAEVDGKGSAITRSLEDLWQSSDSQSDLTLLVSTNFLFSSARSLLPSINERLSESLQGLIADKTHGLAFTTSLADSWYGELRMLGREGAESAKLLEEFRSIAKVLSTRTETKLVETPAHAYWRALAIRYPQMLRALDKHLRFGLENGQLVANFYLPKAAAPNLAIASWMMLQPSSFQVTSGTSTTTTKSANQPTAPPFVLLEHPITISFEQEPLDSALGLLTEELNSSLPPNVPKVSISIDGNAFELSSVTRNQQIRDFRFKGAPLRSLLTDLASRVNPDKTITSVKDPKQAVVWIVGDNAEAPEIIFTTRRGIEGTSKKLPDEFSAR